MSAGGIKGFAIGCGAVTGIGFMALFGFLLFVGSMGPETHVQDGRQVAKRHVERMRELGVLAEGEPVRLFYSSALLDIAEGFYLFTGEKVVLYEEGAEEPATVVPIAEIADLRLYRDESFFTDSTIVLVLQDSSELSFPVSSEKDGDQRFHDALRIAIDSARGERMQPSVDEQNRPSE